MFIGVRILLVALKFHTARHSTFDMLMDVQKCTVLPSLQGGGWDTKSAEHISLSTCVLGWSNHKKKLAPIGTKSLFF